MPRRFTVSELVTRAKRRADMENSGLVSDAEWKEYLHTSYGEWYAEVALCGMRYFEKEVTILSGSLVDDGRGGGTVPLPDDHLHTVGVDRKEGQRFYALEEMMAQDRNIAGGASGSKARWYALTDCDLLLAPKPPSGQEYRHTYIPQPADLEAAADAYVIDLLTPSSERFVVLDMAVAALAKEQSDVRGAVAERERAREKFITWVLNKAMNQPRRPVLRDDSLGAQRWWGGEYDY